MERVGRWSGAIEELQVHLDTLRLPAMGPTAANPVPQLRNSAEWHLIYLDDGSYKFECTYSRCGYRGADREGWKHQIIIQRPQGAVMLPKCSGGKGVWMRTPIELGLA